MSNTGLIPQSLLGNDNISQSISITPTSGIVFNDSIANLTASLSWTGIITDNATGFDILSDLNMNQKQITNVDTLINSSADLNIESDQQLFTTIGKAITIESLNDNTSLFNPSGSVFIDKSTPFTGDGDIYAANFIGSVAYAGNAGTAQTIVVSNEDSNALFYPTFVSNNSGNFALKVDKTATPLTYNPNTSTLSATTFSGSATLLETTGVTNNATYYLPFVSSSATSSGQTLYTDQNGHITFNPSTNQLSTNGTITNNGLTMNGSASQFLINNASASVPAISAPNAQLISFPSANVTATTFTGALSGNASTATTATNSNNSAITDDNTNATFYPVFVSNNTGNLPLKVDKTTNPLSYNPSTGVLTSTTFSGNATTATTATNSNNSLIVSDNSSTTCYIPFTKSTASTGTNLPLYQDDTTTALSYTPSTSTLSCSYGQFGTGIINTSSVACNSSGGLTITGGTAGGLILNSGANTLQLQNNGTTIATIQSTGLAVTQINANGFNIYNGLYSPFSIASTTGISTFTNINTTGFTLPTSINTATFATNTLTIVGSAGATFRNYQIGFTGTTNTITTLSLSAFPLNAEYYVVISNGGSGTLTINATGLGTGIKTTFTSSVLVLTGGYAIMKINYLQFITGGNIYVVSVNNVA